MSKKIALALGSGGARGLAHIGVIKALLINGYEITAISGSSAGAMVGAWYALTKDINVIEEVMLGTTWKRLADIFLDFSSGSGVIAGKKFKEFLDAQYNSQSFSSLKIPFVAVATNYETGEPTVFNSGKIIDAVMASGSVPLVFEPYKIKNAIYVDGGVSMPVPVVALRKITNEKIIAVNLDTKALLESDERWSKMAMVAEKTFNIFRYNLAKKDCLLADYVLEPKTAVKSVIGWTALLEPKAIIEAGEKSALALIKSLS